jgi:hypothetical protein
MYCYGTPRNVIIYDARRAGGRPGMVLGDIQCHDADGGPGTADRLWRGLIRVSGSKARLLPFWCHFRVTAAFRRPGQSSRLGCAPWRRTTIRHFGR